MIWEGFIVDMKEKTAEPSGKVQSKERKRSRLNVASRLDMARTEREGRRAGHREYRKHRETSRNRSPE